MKITTADDLDAARARTRATNKPARTGRAGTGYDLHRLVDGRPRVIGGVTIPFDKGPLGHSDGDAVVHALVDAILGASGLGDMGKHFPSGDPHWKDTSGVEFLKVVATKLEEEGWTITSAHVIAIAEEPRLSPYLQAMSDAMSSALGLEPGTIAVGATTTRALAAASSGAAERAIRSVERLRSHTER